MKHATIADIKPAIKNARRRSERGAAMIARSIEENGFGRSVLLANDGSLIAGSGTIDASAEVGLENVVIVDSDGTKIIAVRRTDVAPGSERAHQLAIADNRTTDLSDFDPAVVAALADEIDLSDFWREDELTALLAGLETPVESVDDPGADFDRSDALVEKYGVAVGQLWAIGPHRLAVGDCADTELVERLMNGETAEMVWTDPPYGVDYHGGTKPRELIENDNLSPDGLQGFLYDCFSSVLAHCENGGAWYVASPPGTQHTDFGLVLGKLGIHHQTLVWVKNNAIFGPMGQDYHWRHETIFYGWKPGAPHRWHGDRKQETVFEFDRPVRSDEHPTMKPVDLIEQCVTNSSNKSDVVLDPFGGSGSTMVACEQLERRCAMVELEPRYAAVILERMAGMGLAPRRVD